MPLPMQKVLDFIFLFCGPKYGQKVSFIYPNSPPTKLAAGCATSPPATPPANPVAAGTARAPTSSPPPPLCPLKPPGRPP